ncbi:MAG: 1,4-dihydroxy-2-naphthoyl-CoA hydrolase [Sodalis sp.]|uniref:hotdog fold thioesterase n=1 Tax=Sodalis sp. (in: enterobacteria) TaxID=1898979 RepID=UPI003872C1E7|nr:MAG: 1,4-dihydroxy-2-naphthoyl-CoA hydrolase [Sodalis sp.]
MLLDEHTRQPSGVLYGSASVVLAETVGSAAAGYLCARGEQRIVGLDINANHLHSMHDSLVCAVCRPFYLGRTRHVWGIHIGVFTSMTRRRVYLPLQSDHRRAGWVKRLMPRRHQDYRICSACFFIASTLGAENTSEKPTLPTATQPLTAGGAMRPLGANA